MSRRWFQFSLRSCLVLTTAVCAWLGWHVRTANRQKEAIAAIQQMGGWVEVDDDGVTPLMVVFKQGAIQNPDGTLTMPPGFTTGLFEVGPKITLTDDGLRHVSSLSDVELVWISGVPITDAGLRRLQGLKKLLRVMLNNTPVTQAGVAELQKAFPACKIEWHPPPKARAATSHQGGNASRL